MNRLASETSPYLRQHRDNPVDWYAWGPDAFAAARERNVPVLLSVGYSSCHWCHVMAHECFEDVETATQMNRLFVNIKVDREERPDVDAVYMDAVQALTGRGGWPLTVFLTPAGDPFFGGTYFPRAQLQQLLTAVDDVWRNRPADIRQNVGALGDAVRRTEHLRPTATAPAGDLVDKAVAQLLAHHDPQCGGFGTAPKFPSAMNLDLLLRQHVVAADPAARDAVVTTLDAMASGGIYDHIGGGFARYSVDERWLVPHFEKMLPDQALLVRLYTHASLALGDARYRQVVEETVGYVVRELLQPEGGFSSAQDADSPGADGHGHEGLFHTFTPTEVRTILGADADTALAWWGITDEGHLDGRSIPNRLAHRGQWARPEGIEQLRQRLFAAREVRPGPSLDDKVVTEWNGLMLSALCEAAAALDRPDWGEVAVANGEFLLRELRRPDGRWHRTWHAGGTPRARHDGIAADHAALVDAFTRLGELTGQARWTTAACEVADTLLDHFWDLDHGGLFTTAADGERLIARQKDLADAATPSANSAAAVALLRLAALTGEARYANQADQILRLVAAAMPAATTAFGQALLAIGLRATGTTEVVIPGTQPLLLAEVRRRWLPDGVLAWGEPADGPLWEGRSAGVAYVCRQHTCALPAATAADLAAQLQ